jgi:putative hemolysin
MLKTFIRQSAGNVDMNEQTLLARSGGLDVRLAAGPSEVAAAQSLRYRVFFEEGAAAPDPASRAARRDLCRFDEVCDHVIALDTSRSGDDPAVVGAYRLLRQDVAREHFGFYSAAEFEVAPLIARHPQLSFMELGRSCVAEPYRSKRTMEALWRGVWAYALRHGVDVMFGCASLPGADPQLHAGALAALAALADKPEWRVEPAARARRVVAPPAASLDVRAAIRGLPPLVKGYLRLGARFAPEAVIDEAFGTTDVFVVLRVADFQARYLQHFAPEPIAA